MRPRGAPAITKMEEEIAKLLNASNTDRDKLKMLLDEYLVKEDDDDDSDPSSDDDTEMDDDTGMPRDEDFDMRLGGYDFAMSRAKDCEDFVTGDNETEFKKASKFRLVFISVLLFRGGWVNN